MKPTDLHPQNDDPVMNELDERDLQITRWIQEMPDLEPPTRLLFSVMESLQPKRLSWWRRIYRWAQTPKTITLTPVTLAPLAASLMIALLFSSLLFLKQKEVDYLQGSGGHAIPVVFRLNLSGIQSVSVIGTFNAWKPKGYEMQWDPKLKRWSLTVLLPEGRYEYMFLLNGQKMIPDPQALFRQEDGFGNQNSVLVLRRQNGETI